jgi:hypothetical protein
VHFIIKLDGTAMIHDKTKCFACSIKVQHSQLQHDEYLAIWCDKHHSWCGDHTQKSIESALNKYREDQIKNNKAHMTRSAQTTRD